MIGRTEGKDQAFFQTGVRNTEETALFPMTLRWSFHALSTSEPLELFLRPGNSPYTRQRDVRSHSIYDLNGGPVTVCSLLPEGSADGGCRSSGLGPSAGCSPYRRGTPFAATLCNASPAA